MYTPSAIAANFLVLILLMCHWRRSAFESPEDNTMQKSRLPGSHLRNLCNGEDIRVVMRVTNVKLSCSLLFWPSYGFNWVRKVQTLQPFVDFPWKTGHWPSLVQGLFSRHSNERCPYFFLSTRFSHTSVHAILVLAMATAGDLSSRVLEASEAGEKFVDTFYESMDKRRNVRSFQ